MFFATTIAFLLFSILFWLVSNRQDGSPSQAGLGRGLSLLRLRGALFLTLAVIACFLLTFLPPKGFEDLFLRYLGEEIEVERGARLVVGNSLEEGYFESRMSRLVGRLYTLENRGGSLWIEPNDRAYALTVDGGPVEAETEIVAEDAVAAQDGRELVIEGRGRGERTRYLLRILPRTVRVEAAQGVAFSLRYAEPVERPIRFPREEEDPGGSAFLLITNRPAPSAHDEIRLPISYAAGPVMAKLEKVAGRSDAVRLVTPEQRVVMSVGQMARVGAFSSGRQVLLQLTDRSFLRPARVHGLLLLLFALNGALLLRLFLNGESPEAVVVYLVGLYLLSLRLVLGVRLASLYPYHYEGFSTSVAGLVLLPAFVVTVRGIGAAAGGFVGAGLGVRTPGGRYRLWRFLKSAHQLWLLLFVSVASGCFLYFLPGRRFEPGPDVSLLLLAAAPAGLLLGGLAARWLVGRSIFHPDVRDLRDSQSLFAFLVEADAVTDGYWLRRFRAGVAACLAAAGVAAVAFGLWAAFGTSDGPAWPRQPLRVVAAGAILLVGALLVFFLARGRHGALLGGLVRRAQAWLHAPRGFGNVLRFWWLSPAGRMTALVTAVVLGMIFLGRRESLIPQPRIPLMLLYSFLFLAMATANMVFIAKKAGKENSLASMLIISVSLAPLAIYAAAAGDYGSIIGMLFPILAVLSFVVMKRRAILALLILTLIIVVIGPPVAQSLGGDYIRFRMASALLGHGALEASPSRLAQNTLEQIKQMAFYATAGDNWLTGLGYGQSPVSAGLRNTALNDNVFSTLILSEMGVLQGGLLCLVYLLPLVVVLLHLIAVPGGRRRLGTDSPGINLPSLAQGGMLVGLCLTVVFIAIYMMAANVGLVPLTGKNLPFLGMNSKSDLLQNLLVFSLMISMLRGGLVTPKRENVKPMRMEEGDRGPRRVMLAVVGGLTVAAGIVTAAYVIGQWHFKPDDVIRFTAYNDRLEQLATASNDYFRRAREGQTMPGEAPPLGLAAAGGGVEMEANEAVIAGVFPDFRETYLLQHVREFNLAQRSNGRSIFQLRRVDRRGDPERDFRIRVDRNYMNISSPFRATGWAGEVLAAPSPPLVSLTTLGQQASIPVYGEMLLSRRPKLRLIPVGNEILLERADLEWQGAIGFKANGYDFKNWHSYRPPPKFLVLREDDFVRSPRGSYLVTHVSDIEFSSIKRVNARYERAYPQGESFYYVNPLATRVGGLIAEYDIEPPEDQIRLTIDAALNQAIYDGVKPLAEQGTVRQDQQRRVAVTVMDLATGDLLALASAPSLDPNLKEGEGLPEYRQIVFENHNLRKHPLGSAMKALFAGASVHAFPELVDLKVVGSCGKVGEMLGFPFGSDISASFGAGSLEDYLAKSSNAFEIYLSTFALARWDGEGEERRIRFSDQRFDDCYKLRLGAGGGRAVTRVPDFGGRLAVVSGRSGGHTQVDKLDESALARSFEELFGIEYHSEQRSYVETQLWEPIKAWLGAADTEGLILEKLEDRLEIDASLPDLSMIPFDRLTHFRNDFLSSTIGGSEGRLHNVKVAEAMARLVTGKMVRAGLVYPMVAAPEPSEAGEGEPASGEDDGSVAPPASADEGGAAIEQWADCPLAESSRERIAKGMARVFKSGGTGRPQEHRALLRELGEHNVAILGKTGTHLDAREGRPTIVDSLMIAAVGRPVDEDEGSRLTEGFVIVIYVGDTVQHQATEVLYALVPAVSSHHRYHHWELEF